MSKVRPCCVPHCDDRMSSRHRFPLSEKDKFDMWVKVVNNQKLFKLSSKQIYRSYYVCNRHFETLDLVLGTKRGLKRDAVPKLFLPSSDVNNENKLEPAAEDTADFILFMDELFDSLNGSSSKAPGSKLLKGGVRRGSPHEEFWRNAIVTLKSMKFYCNKKKEFVNTPSITNLIFTLRAFLYLTKVLLENYKFSYVLTRAFNQDSLENFFGNIRSHGVRNVMPNCKHFITSFKTLLVNNFLSVHSPGSNCEEDFSCGALDNLRGFITGEEIAGVNVLEKRRYQLYNK